MAEEWDERAHRAKLEMFTSKNTLKMLDEIAEMRKKESMVEITCIECGDKFNKSQGSMDERTCTTCILKAEDPEAILDKTPVNVKHEDHIDYYKKAFSEIKGLIEGKISENTCTYCNEIIENGPVIFKEGLPPVHGEPCYLEILQDPDKPEVVFWKMKMDEIIEKKDKDKHNGSKN